ncbi:MAG TPA: ABC transporter permease [Candidatus Angelobacter sp.]|nr:ABC transporter permease [Candidatus Angelobacter sp.]
MDWLQTLLYDVRYAVRLLLRSPGFSLVAVLTVALGIGGNATIFTVTNALLLKPLPYANPDQLAQVAIEKNKGIDRNLSMSLIRFQLIQKQSRSFSQVAALTEEFFNVTGRGEPQQLPSARVSPGFFDLLGVQPQIGRTFLASEGEAGGKRVVMISDGLWKSRFGAASDIVGQNIALDGIDYSIVGVVPSGFLFGLLGPVDIWSPRFFELNLASPQQIQGGTGYLTMIGRLLPGKTLQAANAEMDVLNGEYRQEYPKAPDSDPAIAIRVLSLQGQLVSTFRLGLLMLSAAVGVVLLIACANVASLLLSRALARRKEIAIRAALGARRGVVVRQLLTESVVLAALGGVLGLSLSFLGTRMVARLGRGILPQGADLAVDWHVLTFTVAISLLTGLLFGMFPALQLSKTDMNGALRDEGRGTTGSQRRMQVKSLLVVLQVTLSMLLLIFAGLLINNFVRLQKLDLGFDPHNLLSMNVSLPTVQYAAADRQIAFYDETVRKVASLPGVRSAAISSALPLNPRRFTPALLDGQPNLPLAKRPFFVIETISPDYFKTMGVPLIMGRVFGDQDNAQGSKVLIANQALVKRFWPNENPIGKHVFLGRQVQASEVVGVVGDVRNVSLASESQPQFYIPFPQLPWGNMNIVLRGAFDPHQLVSAAEKQVYSVDPNQPVTNVQTLDEMLDKSRSEPRFTMFVLGGLSSIALVLVIIGIYGVLAYSVAQRQTELGIRMALGAGRSDILRLVLGHSLTLVLIGIVAGLAAAVILVVTLTRFIADLLYKVEAKDATTFLLAAVLFAAVGVVASYVPARRATQVDPNEALRG